MFSNLSGIRNLAAQGGNDDYKALVCIYLGGGNDSMNCVVPADSIYADYAAGRDGLALAQEDLLPISVLEGDGRSYGLHPELTGIKSLFDQEKVAILNNVGPLMAPVSRADYLAGRNLPPYLYSHADQSIFWKTARPDFRAANGWGGRLADAINSLNPDAQMSMSVALGETAFLSGDSVIPHGIGLHGTTGITGLFGIPETTDQIAMLRDLWNSQHNNLLGNEFNQIRTRALDIDDVVSDALDDQGELNTLFPGDVGHPANAPKITWGHLPSAMKIFAKMIGIREQLGMKRHIFSVVLGGFDLHGEFTTPHLELLRILDQSLKSFHDATVELGVASNVTTFTTSEFGRTLSSNGTGCDHGWGGHHFIMGDAVKGGRMYGTYPTIAINGPDDSIHGSWIPTTSVSEYASTLATWFGVPANDLATVVPNIGRFNNPNLGFFV